MNPAPASAITIPYVEIAFDAERFAPGIGLSANTDHPRSAQPRHERVMTVTATDQAAATTVENNRSETLARRLGEHLQSLTTLRLPITYQEAARGLLLLPPNTIHQVTEALEQIMAEDAAADRPFIAALVISKWRGCLPAPGFFDCAARLGRFTGDATGPEARVFHAAEFKAALALWAPTSDALESE